MRNWNSRVTLALAVFMLPLAASAETKKASVKVVNNSDWALDHFFLSPFDKTDWGQDQLGDDIISKGESFTLTNIPCDKYDVKLVDEDGDECVVQDVEICGGGETWTITSEALLKCQHDTDKED